jgi:branched-subunit amino acid transport protein
VTWVLIAVLAVGTLLVKTVGPLVAGGRELPPALSRVIALLAPALLAALVVLGTFTSDRTLVVDARAAGLATALVALLARAPVVVALIAAAAVTALLRLLWPV